MAQHPESSVELVEFDPTTSAPFATQPRDHAGPSSETTWKARWKGRNKKGTLQQYRSRRVRFEREEGKRQPRRVEEEKLSGEDSQHHRPASEGHGGEDKETADMKFSHSIQFNAVQEWSSHYIAYSNLKKL